MKENMSKLRLNLDNNLSSWRRPSSTAHAPLDSKQEFAQLRERMKKDKERRKRMMIEKSYQDFHKKLYVPNGTSASTLSNEDEKMEEEIHDESIIPGHSDVVAEFDSIFIGIYPTILEMWIKAAKNASLAKEIIFHSLITCYYHMICEKATSLKTHDSVEKDKDRYLTLVSFEKNYSKSGESQDPMLSLCRNIVNDIYDDILFTFFETNEVIKQNNQLETATKAFIAKCCEVLWCVLCMETKEKTLLLYPLDFHYNSDDNTSTMNPDVNTISWFEFEEKSDKHTPICVSFPAIVQINKNNSTQQTLLCKAKVFRK